MTAKQLNRRMAAVKTADAINAIEGAPVSDYARTLSLCWARGEITGEQMKAALLASHRRMAEDENSLDTADTLDALPASKRYRKYQKEKYIPEPHYQREE